MASDYKTKFMAIFTGICFFHAKSLLTHFHYNSKHYHAKSGFLNHKRLKNDKHHRHCNFYAGAP